MHPLFNPPTTSTQAPSQIAIIFQKTQKLQILPTVDRDRLDGREGNVGDTGVFGGGGVLGLVLLNLFIWNLLRKKS